MSSRLSASIVLAALTVTGTGCASQIPPSPAPPLETPQAGTPPPAHQDSGTLAPTQKEGLAKPGTHRAPRPVLRTISIWNHAFMPQTIMINDGDTVVWINRDSVPHTTTSDGVLLWDSGTIFPGRSFKRVFHVGTYTYHCGIHPDMQGTVVVR